MSLLDTLLKQKNEKKKLITKKSIHLKSHNLDFAEKIKAPKMINFDYLKNQRSNSMGKSKSFLSRSNPQHEVSLTEVKLRKRIKLDVSKSVTASPEKAEPKKKRRRFNVARLMPNPQKIAFQKERKAYEQYMSQASDKDLNIQAGFTSIDAHK